MRIPTTAEAINAMYQIVIVTAQDTTPVLERGSETPKLVDNKPVYRISATIIDRETGKPVTDVSIKTFTQPNLPSGFFEARLQGQCLVTPWVSSSGSFHKIALSIVADSIVPARGDK